MKLTKLTCSYCWLVFAILTFALAFLLPGIINDQIDKQIPIRAVMSPENSQTWGEIPGKLNVTPIINFTFFNFTNHFEVLYLNHTPEFVETGAYGYQTLSKFLDANFSNSTNNSEGETVEFYPYQWYKPTQDIKDQDLVTIPNLGPLVTWYSMKNAPREKVCIEALINLADGFEKSMTPGIIAQSTWTGFVQANKSSIYDLIFSKAEVPPSDYDYIWDDDQYGWAQPTTFQTWVIAALEGVDNGTSRVLMEYFDLTFAQMTIILYGQLKTYMSAMESNVANMYGCSSVPCEPKYLGYLQWSQQGVTLGLPGPSATESIFETGNSTLSGYPEISYYLKRYFPKTVSNDSIYQNVTFSVPLAQRLFNRSNILHQSLKDWNILIHIGNLAWIFSIGDDFKSSGNLTSFQPMVDRFELESLHQAHVLFSYLNYFTYNFSIQQDENGAAELLIGGGKIAEAIYDGFVGLQDYLLLHLTTLFVKRNATNLNLTCEQIISNSMNIEKYSAEQICSSLNFTTTANSTRQMKQLISSCWYQEGDDWDYLLNTTYLTRTNLLTLCFDANSLFNQLLNGAELALYNHYNCNTLGNRCNKFQIATMQWGNSNITNNVPEFLAGELQNTTTVSDWDKSIFPKPFEFIPVMNFLARVFNNTKISGFYYNHTLFLLNFDHLFNPLIIRKTFLLIRKNLLKNITDMFQVDDPWPLVYYMRYMLIEITFGGFTQTRTVKEILWGYSDSFLATVATGDPIMESGDPSVRSVINLIPNSTMQTARYSAQSLYTGKGNVSKVRMFKKINGSEYISSVGQKFNGNESYTSTFNPWKEKVPLRGTDGAQNPPQMDESEKLNILNPAMYKTIECDWDKNSSFEKSGMSIRRYKISNSTLQSKKNNPANEVFYMDKWDGVINLTATQGAPIYLSKLHYLHADPRLQSSVKIYKDVAKTQKVEPTDEDDSFFDVEPTTGASFGSSLKLQTGYYIQGDDIYSMNFDGLFPVFTIQGGGSITDDIVQSLFGPLKIVFLVRKLATPVGIAIAAIEILLALGLYIAFTKKNSKKAVKIEGSMSSKSSDGLRPTFDTLNVSDPLLGGRSDLSHSKERSNSEKSVMHMQETA